MLILLTHHSAFLLANIKGKLKKIFFSKAPWWVMPKSDLTSPAQAGRCLGGLRDTPDCTQGTMQFPGTDPSASSWPGMCLTTGAFSLVPKVEV